MALICFVISRGAVYYGLWLFPFFAAWLRAYWPHQYPFALALGLFPVSELLGVTLALTSKRRAAMLSWYHRRVTGRDRNFQFGDVFSPRAMSYWAKWFYSR